MCAAMSRACPHCGQTIRADAVACRHCKQRVSTPPAASQQAAQTADPQTTPQAPRVPPVPAAAAGQCPKCGAEVAPDAVLCVNCGHHLALGVNATTVARARRAGGAAKKIGLALTVSGVGCVLGGLVWAFVAHFLHMEIGLLAVGIGFLGGLGIVAVTEVRSPALGAAAAGFALLGIIVGKLLIFQFAAGGVAAELRETPELAALVVGGMMIERGEVDADLAEKLENETATLEDMMAFTSSLQARIEAMSPEELEAVARDLMGRLSYWERIRASLSFWDVLWVLLAMGTAYGMASREK